MSESTTPVQTAQPRNGLGTAGMVLGIIAAAIGLIPFLGFVSFLLGPLAIILGAVGFFHTRGATPKANNPVASLFGVGLGVLGIVLAGLMVAGMNAVVNEIERGVGDTAPISGNSDAAIGDVAVSQCEITDEFGTHFAEATVTITNSTDETQSYMATISVDDAAGDRVGEINVVSNSLAAGQSVDLSGAQATGNVSQDAETGAAECTVANVDRFPSF